MISVLLLTAGMLGCSAKPYAIKYTPGVSEGSKPNTVYVVSHGWHTGLVLPADVAEAELGFLQQRFAGARYYEFGWGDKGFYQAEAITSGLTLRAILWPTGSVMHVVALNKGPYQYFPNSRIEPLCLSDEQSAHLLKFVRHSFQKDEQDAVMRTKDGLYGDSSFYVGEGDYYLMNTCNKWTAKGLRSVGYPISTTFKLTADSVMDFLAEFKAEQQTQPRCETQP